MNDTPEQPPVKKPRPPMPRVLIRRRDRANNLVHDVALSTYRRFYAKTYIILERRDGPDR